MRALPSIDEALRLVLERVSALRPETVPLERAAGRILSSAAPSAVDLPPFDSSAMDGFALRAVDTPGRLRVAARIAAGRPAERALAPGEAFAIATGGVVPEGADAVVPIEDLEDLGEVVEVPAPARVGTNIRSRGGDIARGADVLGGGTRLGAAQLGALAAAGVAAVSVARRPRAAVLVTGTELRTPGQPLRPGEVYEANGLLLASVLERAGAEARRLAAVEDEPELHREALRQALDADVVVTSGGVSVGPHDLVRAAAAELGVEEVFWGVAVKPGKPVAFGVRGSTLVFGLPGNPVSSLVGAELFVRPALLALQGLADPRPRFEPGRLARPVARAAARDQLLRARTRLEADAVLLEPLTGQDSHMIVRAAAADALVLVPRGPGELGAGELVRYLRLDTTG